MTKDELMNLELYKKSIDARISEGRRLQLAMATWNAEVDSFAKLIEEGDCGVRFAKLNGFEASNLVPITRIVPIKTWKRLIEMIRKRGMKNLKKEFKEL